MYDVLLDAPAPRGLGQLQGRTPQDKVVLVTEDPALLGRIVPVRITSGEHWCLRGERIEEELPGKRDPEKGEAEA